MRPYIFPEYVDAYSSRLAAARNGLFVFLVAFLCFRETAKKPLT